MPKLYKLTLLFVAAALAAWAAITYPAVGQLTYDAVSSAEARLYGLHKRRVSVGDTLFTIYESEGQGAPILMLHGFSADKDVWARFARHFSKDHRVIIPDLPGHGETGYNQALDYGISAQVERLIGLLDALKVGQVHVVGNSMGGHMAAQFALDHPERTLSATMIDPAGMPQPHPSEMRRLLAKGHNPFLLESRQAFAPFYAMTMAQPPLMPGFVLDAIADGYVARRSQLAHIFADIERPTSLPERAGEIKAPTLLLWGQQDQLIDVSAVAVWKKAMPQLRVEILNDLGHMPMVERPAETAALYQSFIDPLPR